MKRIVYMVLRNIYRLPLWFYQLCRLCRADDSHTEEERYAFLHRLVKIINRTGRVEVNYFGADKLPEKNGFILFPNHQGLFDSLALIESCPRPFGIVIKKEALQWILVKQVVALLRGIGIDRDDIRASMEVIRQVTEEVKHGRNYIIFPEGTRSGEGNTILPFKGGTFKTAVNAGCPIVPVALIDCFRPFDLPSIRKEKVQVHFLDPIYPEDYSGMKTKEIAALVHDQIQEKINQFI
ncbi:MAG: 1-acyl-sn-glycerol-3-phosphate acyltransferase [Lachnospiraceae bacterium]|nr:1-acyl-sn-glycerol-3-phosphate acyltransferase [Lachnospiraceae bacterium]